ncbi:MAG: hypothetical protein M1838_004532 [Thelocarpon superellum]|nr:MAG: hypothetical protein M1838_004532 [Thelocarpon superellum]
MQQLWANASCDPFDPRSSPCLIGDYVHYAINVSKIEHVYTGLQFIKDNNIRLVIRNTGHDDLGKSTGYGSLGIWLHYIRGLEYLPDFDREDYHGPAIKVLAGDSSGAMLEELAKFGKVAVGGACPTVGMAGGYTPAGGHSPLASLHGLSADNILEFEVITAAGDLVTASPTENSDMFWALRGGGPGTFGIVWSLKTRVYPDVPVATANLSFDQFQKSEEDFFKAIKVYNSLIPAIGDAGGYTYAFYLTAYQFTLYPLFGPNLSVARVTALLQPLLTELDTLGFKYNFSTNSYPTYLDAYNHAFTPWPVGGLFGSRLIPRDTIQNNADGLVSTMRDIYDAQGTLNYISFSPKANLTGNPDNAVLPAWRQTDIHLIIGRAFVNGKNNYSINVADQNTITNKLMVELKELTPHSGAYMNEADGFDPDWQKDFYGSNYPSLLQIKKKWDPHALFWCNRAVGSEFLAKNDKQVLCQV